MNTLLYVHGTGVRKKQFDMTIDQIQNGMNQSENFAFKVDGCLWGDSLGVRLKANGASVPEYDRGRDKEELTLENENIELWDYLYSDPLYELRILSLNQSSEKTGDFISRESADLLIDDMLKDYNIAFLNNRLERAGINGYFDEAKSNIRNSPTYSKMLKKASYPIDQFLWGLSRAIVAEMFCLYKQKEGFIALAHLDSDFRDNLVSEIRQKFENFEAAPGVSLKKILLGLTFKVGKKIATPYLRSERGKFMDLTSPVIGDILLYQAKANQIHELIEMKIHENYCETEKLVIVAHSLGGIACFDLMVRDAEIRNKIDTFITVGSQVPYFYELDILHSIRFEQSLPNDFPKWVNIYDCRDFLSFIGNGVIKGEVTDHKVDNKQAFPESHGAYWVNKKVYEIINQNI